MKFTRQSGVPDGRPYSTYRELTRRDFRRFCAYCFRHEGELGGPGHFDQDHFEPKSVNDGAKARVFLNLYWCCKDCNSKQNKGSNWPSQLEQARGECFCDSCHHDPEDTDYERQSDFLLRATSAAGGYTIRVLRLNERAELLRLLRDRARFRAEYSTMLALLKRLIDRAERDPDFTQRPLLRDAVAALRPTITAYEQFVNADPFILVDPPERPDPMAFHSLLPRA